MAKATVTILCPSGHRRKAQMNPNSNLLTVSEKTSVDVVDLTMYSKFRS